MKRDIHKKLLDWSSSQHRKPLVLQGARQVGKTHALHWLGSSEYENTVYVNFEKAPLVVKLFEETLDPHILITKLSGHVGKDIKPGKHTLIIFDEIQECNAALNALKYFCEEANEFHIAAAGSLLGVKMSRGRSFPVGKVDFLTVYPLTFLEFLEANSANNLRKMLDEKIDLEPLSEVFHQKLLTLLKHYFIVGGMPEVVDRFIKDNGFTHARQIQEAILIAYRADFAKHAPPHDIPRLSLIWDSIPTYLARENKRFIFSALKKGARGRDFEAALRWLYDAGLVYYCHRISKAALPLKAYTSNEIFKIYALDIGLMGALADLPVETLYQGSNVFHEFHGAFVESYVAQQLVAEKMNLYYWESEGQAEIDFICQTRNRIFPMEAKAGINVKSKSLRSFQTKFPDIDRICRTNLLNFQRTESMGAILDNVPLYAVSCALRDL